MLSTKLAFGHKHLFMRAPLCVFYNNRYSFSKLQSTNPETTHEYDLKRGGVHPVRSEFERKEKLNTRDLENIPVYLGYHHPVESFRDHVAYRTVRFLRFWADLFFRKQYLHRAIVLETVAGVPGMVAGMTRHLTSLRRMQHDGGWINKLLHEAENERMHLMTWLRITKPTAFERFLIITVQYVFFSVYFLAYVTTPKTAHRMVGYLEEEAVISYTQFLKEIDEGRIPNTPAPKIAIDYWNLKQDALLRDVVLAIRADEAEHRDANHHLADRLIANVENLDVPLEGEKKINKNI